MVSILSSGRCGVAANAPAGISSNFIERMPLGNGLGDVDGEEFRIAAQARGGGNRLGDNLVVERAHHHEGVERGVLGHLGDAVGAELGRRHLLRIDAELGQDDAQQIGIGIAKADDANAAAAERRDVRDLRLGRALATRRRPQHHEVPAQDRDGVGVGGHGEVAARDREVGLAAAEQIEALQRAVALDWHEPHRSALRIECLGDSQHERLIVAAGQAHGDAQRRRLPEPIGKCERYRQKRQEAR